MYIAIFKNQNEAVRINNLLQRRGVYCEIIATPRKFLKTGSCSYCLKFNSSDIDRVRREANSVNIQVIAIYKL